MHNVCVRMCMCRRAKTPVDTECTRVDGPEHKLSPLSLSLSLCVCVLLPPAALDVASCLPLQQD